MTKDTFEDKSLDEKLAILQEDVELSEEESSHNNIFIKFLVLLPVLIFFVGLLCIAII